mmetsp:Transcript_100004/g.291677  ORF Transcript_100004/g.291677 Transcript_100004/m.291677 type:complete len:550 (+) Transcript_100004:41-1690(+)
MIKPITIWSSSELDTLVSTILPTMVSTFSGQILFNELCTERLSSNSRSPCVSRRGLYAVAEGIGNAVWPVPPVPRRPPSRCLEVRMLSRSLGCRREPNILRSEGSPALAAIGSAAVDNGLQAVPSRVARKPASDSGMGPARLRKAMSDLWTHATAVPASSGVSPSAAELLGLTLRAVISASSEDVEGVQVSASTSWAPPCLASGRTGLLAEATLGSAASVNWGTGLNVALASVCQSSSSQLPSPSFSSDGCDSSSFSSVALAAALAGPRFCVGVSCQSSSSQPCTASSASCLPGSSSSTSSVVSSSFSLAFSSCSRTAATSAEHCCSSRSPTAASSAGRCCCCCSCSWAAISSARRCLSSSCRLASSASCAHRTEARRRAASLSWRWRSASLASRLWRSPSQCRRTSAALAAAASAAALVASSNLAVSISSASTALADTAVSAIFAASASLKRLTAPPAFPHAVPTTLEGSSAALGVAAAAGAGCREAGEPAAGLAPFLSFGVGISEGHSWMGRGFASSSFLSSSFAFSSSGLFCVTGIFWSCMFDAGA